MINIRSVGVPGVILAIAASALHSPLVVSTCLSVLASICTYNAIPLVSEVFIKHGRFGKDLLKEDRPIIPESMGVVVGVVYFISMFLFIPVPFISWFNGVREEGLDFPHHKFAQFLGGLLALFSMLFLGFADDVLDIRWRVKIWFPLIASLPLLMVYAVTYGGTDVLIPLPLRGFFSDKILHLGIFYYGYMAALTIFATNAVNIVAGINGIEGGQTIIIAISLAINDMVQILTNPARRDAHMISLYFLLPFIGTTFGYLKHNWYPARAFGGDTFTYFAGMIFAVVGILGNFSKTVLLFMIPQIFNFVYSCPQLFHLVDCPRHRMPKINPKTSLIHPSTFDISKSKPLGKLIIQIFKTLGLTHITIDPETKRPLATNFTLINLVLVKFGPMSEAKTTLTVIIIQALSSCLAFTIRYLLVHLVYNREE
ncbi:hypothetical protein HK097_007702 [Rhizophlyctis rosea]|uniref:UDP-N-acetylglucosamine--dolichyl-phosphate N-acetylglucosaminephosphotransferase n=1 Tax=Rhizophlyctis rosea TaxID=64517 RepID=A0AAD5SLF0_9FUNG|nr:hypothetical protein HK097_007702 [Rhizophlyctis rosea]